MHQILKPTELRRLRNLGHEVFNPPYISDVFDQSADLSLDADQPSTLPRDVFDVLHRYNFFYNSISENISEILNTFFDLVIVTINPDWLAAVVRAYNGPIVFRTYGQPYSMSSHLVNSGLWKELRSRDHFSIMPFAAESVENEHTWFLDLCSEIVPYQIPDDTFAYTQRWNRGRSRSEIATNIPNIQNPYYANVYHHFHSDFPQRYLRIFGPQRELPADARVMGRMDRSSFLKRLSESAGFLYPYRDDVCYLPPIEMMQIGGPVVYLPGSLLAKFNDASNPGFAVDAQDAGSKINRLVSGDRVLAAEIISAQDPVRRRYDRDIVGPIFDKAFTRIVGSAEKPAKQPTTVKVSSNIKSAEPPVVAARTIAVPLHIDGLFHYIKGKPYATEGIPRVIDIIIDTVIANSDVNIIVSCTPSSEALLSDFFADYLKEGRLSLYVLSSAAHEGNASYNAAKLEFVSFLNRSEKNILSVFVPHYYLFPECLLLTCPMFLYLPDYFPYLMPAQVFDGSREKDSANKAIGLALARKCKHILTNSYFTKSYLPAAGFVDDDRVEKIVVAPLPVLGRKRAEVLTATEEMELRSRVRSRSFLFYPTANRPNKQLSFLIRLVAHLRLSGYQLNVVLTCDLNSVPQVNKDAVDFEMLANIITLPGISEGAMRWLYENTIALCLTSTAEGNFPPQMLEALNYGAPIVATRLPTIEEVVGSSQDKLLLCNPCDLGDFAEKVEIALEQRAHILAQQSTLLDELDTWNSSTAFKKRLNEILPVFDVST